MIRERLLRLKNSERQVCVFPELHKLVKMQIHPQATHIVPRPLFTGSGILASLAPSLSRASTSLRFLASCLAVKSPSVTAGAFRARLRFAGWFSEEERLMERRPGTYAHPGAEVFFALASSMTPKLFIVVSSPSISRCSGSWAEMLSGEEDTG